MLLRICDLSSDDLMSTVRGIERTLSWMDGYREARKGLDDPDGYIMSVAQHIALNKARQLILAELNYRREQFEMQAMEDALKRGVKDDTEGVRHDRD